MSPETAVALIALGGTLIVSCVSIGIAIGVLKGKVDTQERDLNEAFRMIREIQKQENEK